MSDPSVSELLAMIDEYVAKLKNEELSSAYDRSASSFFNFLRQYRCEVGRVVELIKRCTGMNPNQIRTCTDVEILRNAISRYEYSETLGRRIKPGDTSKPGKWAYENTAFVFDEREEPPQESDYV